MADETCISVYLDEEDTTVNYCWENTVPQPTFDSTQVETGLRQSTTSQARAWKTCQYYLKGLPATCKWWGEDPDAAVSGTQFKCLYVEENTDEDTGNPIVETDDGSDPPETVADEDGNQVLVKPSGYNNGYCDFLGRRSWCTKYTVASGTTNEDEWICAAPNPYLTGLGKRIGDGLIMRPIYRSEILGYNQTEDGTGTGQCDCYGMGRGAAGCAVVGQLVGDDAAANKDKEKQLEKLNVKCNYFRPYQMGFGIIEPQQVPKQILKSARLDIDTAQEYIDEVIADEHLSYRLPIGYELYNVRARIQPCMWYDKEKASPFVMETTVSGVKTGYIVMAAEEVSEGEEVSEDPDAFNSAGRLLYCTCPNSSADPYRYKADSGTVFVNNFAQHKVIARSNTAICNGAKPECPCYSASWLYCVDERMLNGMAITAEQIMELRFWTSDWETQEQYTRFFQQFPNSNINSDGVSTAIFTFDQWDHGVATEHEDSIMIGKRVDLCQPVPYHLKDFRESIDAEVLERELIRYAPIYVKIGTTTEEQRTYPSLVRKPEFPDMQPLEVYYPYRSSDPFNVEVCGEPDPNPYVKYSNNTEGDEISAVGYTYKNKKVYVLNGSVVKLPSALYNNYGVYDFSADKRNAVIYTISKTVAEAFEYYPDYVAKGTSNSTSGYFNVGPVKLQYNGVNSNGTNKIFIFVDYGDGTWEYRIRNVKSIWCGGLVLQKTFEHEYDSSSFSLQPKSFSPSASASFEVQPLGGSVEGEVKTAFHRQVIRPITGDTYTVYDYHAKWVYEENQYQQNWVSVGNSNRILLEIDDTNINSLFDWEIDSALLEPRTQEDEETLEEVKIRPEATETELEVVSIEGLPPNVVVLKPKDNNIRIRFLPSEWDLYIDYSYVKYFTGDSDSDDDVEFGAGANEFSEYFPSPYDIEEDQITSIETGPVAVVGHFIDPEGRLQSAFATKFLMNVVSLRCRSVDIEYRYSATGREYVLVPSDKNSGVNPDRDRALGTTREIWELPRCGDHEYSDWNPKGPMWYPFNYCDEFQMYNEFTGANFCTAGYVGPVTTANTSEDDIEKPVIGIGQYVSSIDGVKSLVFRRDYRFCGPHEYVSWADVRAGLRGCSTGWTFYYADARDAPTIFRGTARIRGPIDEELYTFYDWDLPPFGNEGTDLVEKFISNEYYSHYVGYAPSLRSEWVPLVMDHSMFFYSFNSYEDSNIGIDYALSNGKEGVNGNAYMIFNPQMMFFVMDTIAESIQDKVDNPLVYEYSDSVRYRFEEVFDVQYETACSYPHPTIVKDSGRTTVNNFYTFIDDDFAWAWQEYWRPIKRLDDIENRLNFVEFDYPDYVYDQYKNEHRIMPAEGDYEVKFIISEDDDEDSTVEGGLRYPGIQFGDGPIRYFKILYGTENEEGVWAHSESDYDDSQIEWMDEGADGLVDGSSDDNPYEEASTDDQWLHVDEDFLDYFLFDGDVTTGKISEAESANRKFVKVYDELEGGDVYRYFNRGIKVNIPKSRLDYLPKNLDVGTSEAGGGSEINLVFENDTQIFYLSEELDDETTINATYVWGPVTSGIVLETDTDLDKVIQSISFFGTYGRYREPEEDEVFNVVKPGISISFTNMDGKEIEPRFVGSIPSDPEESEESDETNMISFNVKIDLLVGPIELIKNRISQYSITLTGPEGSYIGLNEISVEYASLKNYSEVINLRERKYIVSNAGAMLQPNLDGTGDFLKSQRDNHNSGQYFVFKDRNYKPNDYVSAQNKLRSVFCGPYYENDVPIQVSIDTLKEVEDTEQEKIYVETEKLDTVGDYLDFYEVIPPNLEFLFYQINPDYIAQNSFGITAQKLIWQNHYLTDQLYQYDFWRPGGHKYTWSQDFVYERCSLFGPIYEVFSGYYEHMNHTGIGTPTASESDAVDPVRSYFQLRYYVTIAKYDRFLILTGGEPDAGGDIVTNANLYSPDPQSGGGVL